MIEFMKNVRWIVIPRLSNSLYRNRAADAELLWQPTDFRIQYQMFIGNGTIYGETCDWEPGKYTVALYSDNFRGSLPNPLGDLIAYTLIHKLGHVASRAGHDSPLWVEVCREMGIDEALYSPFTPNPHEVFQWLDPELLTSIRALSTYPTSLSWE